MEKAKFDCLNGSLVSVALSYRKFNFSSVLQTQEPTQMLVLKIAKINSKSRKIQK